MAIIPYNELQDNDCTPIIIVWTPSVAVPIAPASCSLNIAPTKVQTPEIMLNTPATFPVTNIATPTTILTAAVTTSLQCFFHHFLVVSSSSTPSFGSYVGSAYNSNAVAIVALYGASINNVKSIIPFRSKPNTLYAFPSIMSASIASIYPPRSAS